MKQKLLLSLSAILFTVNAYSYEPAYKKDYRSTLEKHDSYNRFQTNQINQLDILKALEIAGINMYKIPLKEFDRKYQLTVTIDEYTAGEKTNSKTLFSGDNTYIHFPNPEEYPDSVCYDFLDQLFFYMKNEDEKSTVTLETLSMTTRHVLNKKKDRERQFYLWRKYAPVDWKLNKEIPLMALASSWFDEKYNVERFCSVVELSPEDEQTKELLNNSPHYYIISYKISE